MPSGMTEIACCAIVLFCLFQVLASALQQRLLSPSADVDSIDNVETRQPSTTRSPKSPKQPTPTFRKHPARSCPRPLAPPTHGTYRASCPRWPTRPVRSTNTASPLPSEHCSPRTSPPPVIHRSAAPDQFVLPDPPLPTKSKVSCSRSCAVGNSICIDGPPT
jgi:hypothetical protein